MLSDLAASLTNLYADAKANDLPNWFALAFTAVLWPVVLFLWQRRKVNGVPGLEAHFVAGHISFGGKSYDAVDINFTNHTGSVVYISGARIRSCTRAFPVPVEASRDVAANSYRLKFLDSTGNFTMREVTLQTAEAVRTSMPAASPMPVAFFGYAPLSFARYFRYRKYFVLEYTVMVGTSRYLVATYY